MYLVNVVLYMRLPVEACFVFYIYVCGGQLLCRKKGYSIIVICFNVFTSLKERIEYQLPLSRDL